MSEVVEILKAAKAEIVKQGWRQGQRYADAGLHPGKPRERLRGCCASDAFIDAAVTLNANPEAAIKLLNRTLSATGTSKHLIAWNDEPGRTVEEVYALYDKAIELAKEAAA